MKRIAILLLAVATPALAQSNGNGNGGGRTASGAFTEDQATRGENVFRATCGSCHTPSDHMGPQFKMNWFGKTVYDYFANLKKTMPDDNPGGLSDDEYTRVIAYILKLNGFSAGTDSLKADSVSLKLIKIELLPGDTTKPPNRTRQ